MPRELSESDCLESSVPRSITSIMKPARMTEYVKPETAIKAITNAAEIIAPALRLSLKTSKIFRMNRHQIERCRPETAIRCDIPADENESETLFGRSDLSPIRSAVASAPRSPGIRRETVFLI